MPRRTANRAATRKGPRTGSPASAVADRLRGRVLRQAELDPGGLAPELIEPVEVPSLLDEDVEDAIEVVDEHPARLGQTLDPAGQQRVVVPSAAIDDALSREIEPFLTGGASRALGSRQRNQWYFDDLRQRVPQELRELVGQLEELCERRRQLNVQQRLHFWLHNWLWLHLPFSVALVVLLVGHIVKALRFG